MHSVSVHSNIPIKPEYARDIYVHTFLNVPEFQTWKETVLLKHATFRINQKRKNVYGELVHYYKCNHAFSPRIVRKEGIPDEKRRRSRQSIKVNCKAKCIVTFNKNDTVFVEYHWEHSGHDPMEAKTTTSKRNKLKKQVDQ